MFSPNGPTSVHSMIVNITPSILWNCGINKMWCIKLYHIWGANMTLSNYECKVETCHIKTYFDMQHKNHTNMRCTMYLNLIITC